jgi:hypothetical protein
MTTQRVSPLPRVFRPRALAFAATAIAVLLAAPAVLSAAARATDEALTLVPPDSASVALLRFNELRSSPLAGKLFSDADHITSDGDAARFLEDARLDPRTDVDTIVIVGFAPAGSGPGSGAMAVLEGRFDPDRLAAAAESRGAVRTTVSGGAYYLLPDKGTSRSGRTAAAFLSPHLVVAGTEGAVAQAVAARAAGGTSFLSGAGLGKQLSRIDRLASAWAIVDVTRYPGVQKGMERGEAKSRGTETATALIGAMKSVTLFAFQASVKGDGLDLAATGVARDPDTRQLLEDSLRGVIAMWRLAVQDKQPDLVPILRRFQITSDGDAVTISGNLPGSVLKSLGEKRSARRMSGDR